MSRAIIQTQSGAHFYTPVHQPKLIRIPENSVEKETDFIPAVVEPFNYKTQDGLSLRCYLTFRAEHKYINTPLIVIPHGGPWQRDTAEWNSTAQWLCSRGYKVLMVNFRATKGFGKQHMNAGRMEWGGKLIDDIAHATQYALEHFHIDGGRIGLLGRSFGGYASTMSLLRYPALFKCAVAGDMPTNLLQLFEIPYWKSELPIVSKHIGDPNNYLDREIMEKYSPCNHTSSINNPLFYHMGEVQPEGILDDIRKTMHGIQSHNLHLTYACFKDELHSVQQPIHRQYLMYLQERFLSNHLGGDCEQWPESTPRPKLFEQLHLDRIDRALV